MDIKAKYRISESVASYVNVKSGDNDIHKVLLNKVINSPRASC